MPPLSGPRAVQVSRTLKHLVPLGWESSVVCFGPRSNRYNQDRELASRLRAPDGVTLVPVPSLEERLVFRALWRVAAAAQAAAGREVGLDRRGATRGRVAARRRAAGSTRWCRSRSRGRIISIGLRVHRATGLPWVAHFSDPWTDSPYLQRPRLAAAHLGAHGSRCRPRRRRARVRERADRRSGDAQVPDGMAPQGARRAARVRSATSRRRAGRRRGRSALTIVYTGRFYDGVRTPEPLLRALAALSTAPAARARAARRLRRHADSVASPPGQRRSGSTTSSSSPGGCPSPRARSWAAAADVLLVIDAPADESLFLPSKLIDYLPAGKPILALTPLRGASADLIRALGYPVIPPDDEPAIAAAIEALLAAHARAACTRRRSTPRSRNSTTSGGPPAAFAEILARCA